MIRNPNNSVNLRLESLSLLLLLIISNSGIAQGEMDNWIFGQKAGLNFSSDVPEVIPESKLSSIEACATISDNFGNLLFYSECSKVYNREHEVMVNGNIDCNGDNAGQGTGIVPMPNEIGKYYLFYLQFTTTDYCGLKYAIIDMSLDDGRGGVVEKDQILREEITEKLTFVQQPDSENVWIITHDYDSDKYSVVLLSDSGFSEVKTYATGIHQTGRYGYLQPSPDGTMLAAAVKHDGFIELCCFDPIEGTISSSFQLEIPNNPYGICFSPDNSKLYATAGSPNHVYQFDLTQESISLIQGSRVQLSTTPFIDYAGATGALQLAPNGKIYLARPGINALGIINYPNEAGMSCGYFENGVSLGPTGISQHGLPNAGNLFMDQTPANVIDCAILIARAEHNGCGGVFITPNPTFESVFVKSVGNKISSIMVFDVSGRLIVSKTELNDFETHVNDLQTLERGAYIFRVAHGQCVYKKKIVVL